MSRPLYESIRAPAPRTLAIPDPTVFIVDDDRAVCEAIELLMDSVGLKAECYDSAQALLDAFDPERPGCIVLDVRLKGMSGLDLQERLAEEPLHPPVIVLTGHADVPMAVRAVKAGAVDFLEKPFHEQDLLDAVHRAFAQDAHRRGQASRLADLRERLARLTPREREIMDAVVAGKRNKTIAAELGIRLSTVEAHRAKVMDKMQARSLSELMRMALATDALAGSRGDSPAPAGASHPQGPDAPGNPNDPRRNP